MAERLWARVDGSSARIATDYDYYDAGDSGLNTGELRKIAYSDATPDVEFTYTRAGGPATVLDAAGLRTFGYESHGLRNTETFADPPGGSGLFDGKKVTTDPDFTVQYTPPGGSSVLLVEFAGLGALKVGTTADATADYEVGYGYDNDTGRLMQVTGAALPNNGVNYTYAAGAPWVTKIEYKQSTTAQATINRSYEADRDLLASVENKWGSTRISQYNYLSDELGRRTSVVYNGNAFTGQAHDDLGYNGRSELVSSMRYDNPNPGDPNHPDAALHRAYSYDPIGNRTISTRGTDPAVYYCANELNQYETLDSAATCPPGSPDESFAYDADGNLTQDGEFAYAWDAENRLIRVEPAGSPVSGDKKLEFSYDYMGRRIEKKVSTHNGSSWGTPAAKRFIYTNWLCLVEYEVDGGGDLVTAKKYAWGLDLAGLNGAGNAIDQAAGIGGLVATRDVGESRSFLHFYDGNGNVTQLIDRSDGSVAARYEYDAYGNITAQTGDYADENSFRFSTRVFDPEIATIAYPYRIYEPRFGRWLSRDPVGESHRLLLPPDANHKFSPRDVADGVGLNDYRYNRNTVARIDPLGGQSQGPPTPGDARSSCARTGWFPLRPDSCYYGRHVLFAADFVMKSVSCGQCTPHIIQLFGASGSCTARVAWPLDCVCRNMPDSPYSNCVRGCLRCIFDSSGQAASYDDHAWCFQKCGTGLFGWLDKLRLYEKLDPVIQCCALKQGTIIGGGEAAAPGPVNPRPLQKTSCCGCGPGSTRHVDCARF